MKAELLWMLKSIEETPGRSGKVRRIYMRPICELPPGARLVGLHFPQIENYVDGAAVVRFSIGGIEHMMAPIPVAIAAACLGNLAYSGMRLSRHPVSVGDLEIEISRGRWDKKPPRVSAIVTVPHESWG